MKHRHQRSLGISVALTVALELMLSGCATPIGIETLDPGTVHRRLTLSALASDEPSLFTRHVLTRNGLVEAYARDPEATLAGIRERLFWAEPSDPLFALAELSFLWAEKSGDRRHYLATALFAYAFLFPEDPSHTPDPFDPRLRLAADLYNRGLTEGLEIDGEIELRAGRYSLPFGSLWVEFDESQLVWGTHRLDRFDAAAKIGIRGIRNRYRRPGLGAPLSASTEVLGSAATSHDHVAPGVRVPVTAFLRIAAPSESVRSGQAQAALELYTADVDAGIQVQDRKVPLEYESTSPLAQTLSDRRVWDFEIAGFFSGDQRISGAEDVENGLILIYPYRPGRIPVVLVHGTASSPGRWAELVNELQGVDLLREKFQPWLFVYNTGQPVAYSAGLLREALEHAVADFDPDEGDPALRRMVVIGHSQGGLLTKMTAISSGDRFWRNVSDTPLDELDLEPETRHVLRRSLFIEPLSFVERVVFVATPHAGSYLTRWRISYWLGRMVSTPNRLMSALGDLVTRNPDAVALASLDDIPSSIDNMHPGNPFLTTLHEIPIDPRIESHSIIPVLGEGPPEEGNDGVVEYTSAHIDGVVSEKVVHSGHSTQANPETMREIARILLSQLGFSLDEVPEVEPGGAGAAPDASPGNPTGTAPPADGSAGSPSGSP